ncbi:MAG: selenide, water dikinase SelD [Cyanobacteria bacterium P01_A01_bin.45]
MQQELQPVVKDLVLVGGGHSHAIVMKMWGMKPLPGIRLTVITNCTHTPYSGMLPGHVAGFYSQEESHIDLRRLAEFSQAKIFLDTVIDLNLDKNQVICANRPPVSFDVLSIDIGSTPATILVPGAADNTIPAKPVPQFLKFWNSLTEDATASPQQALSISIVGGGAGGVELALSMQAHLKKIIADEKKLNIHLFQRNTELLPNHHRSVRTLIKKVLLDKGIKLHNGENVSKVDKNLVICDSGLQTKSNQIFWVTQASAPEWLRKTGITLDKQGFILVNDSLQSLSHSHIFAAGDIATMSDYPRPKAGVFAVRQGKPLFKNLQRFLQNKPVLKFKPQKQYLSLIGTGDGKAIATRGWFTLPPSQLVWKWKDYIDRKFMEKFNHLPQMKLREVSFESFLYPASSNTDYQSPQMRCAGCGSKVGSSVLKKVLQRVKKEQKSNQSSNNNQKDIIIGLDAPDDAAVLRIPSGKVLVQTVDYFRSLIEDPYIFGQIATNHCLSDIFAMGAIPQSALAIATIPYGAPSQVEETLYQLLSGTLKVLNQAQAVLIGGHTAEDRELGFGLSCNGLAVMDNLLRKGRIQPEQTFILTKALGTGTLFAANMRYQAKGKWIDSAVESMLLSNQNAAKCLIKNGATACTDVTGFGLLGHLLEMLQSSKMGVELQLDAIPILPGAIETIRKGIFSSLHPENLKAENYIFQSKLKQSHPHYPLLFDPQTSGGLLATVSQEKANSCVGELKSLGYKDAAILGKVVNKAGVFLI